MLEVGFDSPVFHAALTKPAILTLVTGFLNQVAPGLTLRLTQGASASSLEDKARALFGDTLEIQ